jgi:enamine deaminase RidA (YjgF/YER057c/UK114 family)
MTMTRQVFNPGGRSGPGMSAAVRVGATVAVSGQVALDENGALVGEDDCAEQARQCFRNIERALAGVGATLADVVQATGYLADVADAPKYLAVRQATFPVDPPATTTVVAALLSPSFLVEVQVLAVVPEG